MSLPTVIAQIGDLHRDTVRLVFDDKSTAEYSIHQEVNNCNNI